jgi:hypothetical protein
VSAHRLLVFLKILVAFPPNYLGLLIGLVMPFMLGFQRELSAFDWLTMAFFNVPNLIFLRSAILNETPVSSPTFMAALGISFLGWAALAWDGYWRLSVFLSLPLSRA